ncbi:MAG: thymidylate kinase [Clostridia bacterium]|nr:thymidylate kinase [Clostridia bacterium]
MKKGVLIAIDGLDGSGKETQSRRLCEYLEKQGIRYRCVSFPNYNTKGCSLVEQYLGGDFGEDPMAVNAYAASSFFAMDRYSSYMLDWKKDYEEGAVIIANRYTSANLVHQMAKLSEGERGAFMEWLTGYEYGLLGLPEPDGVIYLCVPPAVSESLVQKRCDTTGALKDIHEKNSGFLAASYSAALYASEQCGWHRIDCVSGGDMRSIEDIGAEVASVVDGILGKAQ